MKLKYYLRGMGVGIIVTTVIFMILIFIHRNDGVQQNVPVQDTESKTVAEYENSTQEAEDTNQPTPADTETLKSENKPNDTAKQNEQDAKPEAESEDQPESEGSQDGQEEQQAGANVQIEISDGQFSDTVCKMLQQAGLVEDAADFNRYLIDNNFDSSILPGVYEIPVGSTYEEIAALLTRK